MSANMALLRQLKDQISTHDCPRCEGPAYCAMDDGKSANLCWCMDVAPKPSFPVDPTEECLCRRCLTAEPE